MNDQAIQGTTPNGSPPSPAAPGSAKIHVSNESKIRFSNAFHAMQNHLGCCSECCVYMYDGEGDLCSHGKEIIAALPQAHRAVTCPCPGSGVRDVRLVRAELSGLSG